MALKKYFSFRCELLSFTILPQSVIVSDLVLDMKKS